MTLRVISPERIVQIAGYSNQIDQLTDWVICTAFRECTDLMNMENLSDMGIKLSVDDYGTGFSSLGYLKLFNELKIDKTFVMNMLEDESDEIIVRSTIELAHNLGLEVVAEGVEDEDTLIQLRKLKYDAAQGYHISRPVSIQAQGIWLEKQPLKVANG